MGQQSSCKKFKSLHSQSHKTSTRLRLIKDISANITASKTLGRSVLTCACQERGTKLALRAKSLLPASGSLVEQEFHPLVNLFWFPRILHGN